MGLFDDVSDFIASSMLGDREIPSTTDSFLDRVARVADDIVGRSSIDLSSRFSEDDNRGIGVWDEYQRNYHRAKARGYTGSYSDYWHDHMGGRAMFYDEHVAEAEEIMVKMEAEGHALYTMPPEGNAHLLKLEPRYIEPYVTTTEDRVNATITHRLNIFRDCS